MTPREGPVAWAVIDKDGEFWDAAPLSSKEYADKRAAVLNRTRDGYPTPYTVVPLYAHPAATAREEGEPCPPVLDEGYIGWKEAPLAMKGALANANEWLWWFIRRDNPGASGSLRDYLAALALARSTGGNNG